MGFYVHNHTHINIHVSTYYMHMHTNIIHAHTCMHMFACMAVLTSPFNKQLLFKTLPFFTFSSSMCLHFYVFLLLLTGIVCV